MDDKKSLDEVNRKLDDILLQFFKCLGELYEEQANLETYMKNGYLMMSRARYNMGAKSVGVSQYDENKMKATNIVFVNTDNDGVENEDKMFQLVSSKDCPVDISNDAVSEGLRQRKGTETKVETITHGNEMTKKTKTQSDFIDPIKWFGVLVPQALRQSQGYFKQALECAVTVSNLKSNVVNLKEQYKSLKKEKQALS